MALPLTPDMISAAYTFLLTTPPFLRWKLPAAHEMRFKVSGNLEKSAEWSYDGVVHTISVSRNCVGHTNNLMAAVAHECIHVRLKKIGHGAEFKRCAALVCRYHGFDLKLF